MTKLILKRRLEKNRKRGFTLIELIVVIVIIAIIAAIAVPALARYIDNANNRAAQANAHNIQVVLQAEVTQFYETQLNTLVEDGTGTQDTALFAVTPPHAPVGYPTSIAAILTHNGVTIEWGTPPDPPSLSRVGFDNRRLSTFTYIHSNGARVDFDDGIYTFPPA